MKMIKTRSKSYRHLLLILAPASILAFVFIQLLVDALLYWLFDIEFSSAGRIVWRSFLGLPVGVAFASSLQNVTTSVSFGGDTETFFEIVQATLFKLGYQIEHQNGRLLVYEPSSKIRLLRWELCVQVRQNAVRISGPSSSVEKLERIIKAVRPVPKRTFQSRKQSAQDKA